MFRHRAGWLALGFSLAACGGTSTTIVGTGTDAGADADANSGPSVSTACGASAAAQCAKLESCSSELMKVRYGTTATCEIRLTANCTSALAAPSTGNTPTDTLACSKAYAGWDCTDYLNGVNVPDACTQKKGQLATAASCAFPAQCATGFCAIPPNAACGSCQEAPGAGDSCSDLATCGQGLTCFANSKVCGTLGASGASCDKGTPCGAHLNCIGANAKTGTMGTCTASATKAGDSCDSTLTTGPGCDNDVGLTCNSLSEECEPITVSNGGGPCDKDNDQFATCAAGGTCSTSEAGAMGTCAAAASDGHACSTATGGPGCLSPARCVVTTGMSGTCQVPDGTTCK